MHIQPIAVYRVSIMHLLLGTGHMMLNTFNIGLAFVVQTNERYKLKIQS